MLRRLIVEGRSNMTGPCHTTLQCIYFQKARPIYSTRLILSPSRLILAFATPERLIGFFSSLSRKILDAYLIKRAKFVNVFSISVLVAFSF